MPLVSVILLVYGYNRYLKEAVDSILNQTLKDLELIIVEDPKEDKFENEKLIKNYKDKRIKYIKNKSRLGVANSLNKGIKNSKSKYIAIQDSDDISLPYRLEKQYILIKTQKNLAVVGSNMLIIDDKGNVLGKRYYPSNEEEIKKKIILRNLIGNPTVMFKKEIICKVGGYNHIKGYCMDYDLWLRILNNDYKIVNINEFLVKYRYHTQSFKCKKFKNNLKDTIKLQLETLRKYKNINIPLSFPLYLLAELILLILPTKLSYFLFEKFSVK